MYLIRQNRKLYLGPFALHEVEDVILSQKSQLSEYEISKHLGKWVCLSDELFMQEFYPEVLPKPSGAAKASFNPQTEDTLLTNKPKLEMEKKLASKPQGHQQVQEMIVWYRWGVLIFLAVLLIGVLSLLIFFLYFS